MTDQFTQPHRHEPKRDRFGRYLLPHPKTNKEQAWTRVTTFAKTISDMYGLGQWQQRMVAKGIASRPDLYALAAATPVDDKAKFDKLCKDALEAAAASSGANLGTALHSFTEQVDAGQTPVIPPPWDADIAAYRTALTAAGITADPAWIERVVVFPELAVAGTLDRVLTLADGRRVIGDVKTGKDLSYSWGEIAIQLACYAAATHVWTPPAGPYTPMLHVDQETAVVIHLPAGKARCDLYTVDIAAGLSGVDLCAKIRDWRSSVRKLAAPLTLDHAATTLDLINTAADLSTLQAIIEAASTAAGWTSAHTEAATRRLTQLQSTAA